MLTAAACLAAVVPIAAVAAETGTVEVKDAWARATPAKADAGAAYLTVLSPDADRLTAVTTPAAKSAELHTMSMEGGVMKMRPLAGLDLPAGKPVTLRPGQVHIMLRGLAHPLREGENFPLTLKFAKSPPREVTVVVEAIGAMGPPGAAAGAAPMPMAVPAPAHAR
jgi:periplasmic copper chaperone A